MAYNILKDDVEFSGVNLGNIEDMINDHADQTVGGTKTFSDMVTASAGVSASVYYGDGTNLSGISAIPGGADGAVQFNSSSALSGNTNFTYDGTDVTIGGALSASFLSGSGQNIYNLTPANINGTLNASQINLGQGLEDDSNNIRVKLDSNPGLSRANSGIKVAASGLADAGALSNTDLFIVDQSGNKKATALQIYNYIDGKITIPVVAGADEQIQFNDAGDLGASSNLTFNSTAGLLTSVSGNFQTLEIEGQSGDNSILTLDKGEDSASYIEFRNGGTKYAEIFGSSAEAFIIRTTTTTANFILRQGGDNLITFSNGNTTFDNNKVTINQELVVTGTMETTSRIHSTTVHTASYSIAAGDEIILMNNSAVATASLPPISSDLVGLALTIKRTGAGTVHISGSNGIDSQPTIDISPQGGFVRIVAADFGGSNFGWAIIAKSGSF